MSTSFQIQRGNREKWSNLPLLTILFMIDTDSSKQQYSDNMYRGLKS